MSDLSILKKLVENIDYDIYKGLFVNPEDKDQADSTIKQLLLILADNKPKVILNKDFNKFVKLLKKVCNGDGEEKILHDTFDELSTDLYDVIQELIYEREHDCFNIKTEKQFIMYALTKPSFCFVEEFVKDIEL